MVSEGVSLRFNEIYDSTYRVVLTYVTAKCSNTSDIKDIVQDVYIELFQLLEKRGVDYIKNEKAIALKIVGQKLSRYYSAKKRSKHIISLTDTDGNEKETDLSDTDADSFMSEDFFCNHILLEDARSLVLKKPQDVKKVFYLFYDVGLSISEIAKALSISESSVKNKLYRTLKELRALLQ